MFVLIYEVEENGFKSNLSADYDTFNEAHDAMLDMKSFESGIYSNFSIVGVEDEYEREEEPVSWENFDKCKNCPKCEVTGNAYCDTNGMCYE